jgi:hypothetical protein
LAFFTFPRKLRPKLIHRIDPSSSTSTSCRPATASPTTTSSRSSTTSTPRMSSTNREPETTYANLSFFPPKSDKLLFSRICKKAKKWSPSYLRAEELTSQPLQSINQTIRTCFFRRQTNPHFFREPEMLFAVRKVPNLLRATLASCRPATMASHHSTRCRFHESPLLAENFHILKFWSSFHPKTNIIYHSVKNSSIGFWSISLTNTVIIIN